MERVVLLVVSWLGIDHNSSAVVTVLVLEGRWYIVRLTH